MKKEKNNHRTGLNNQQLIALTLLKGCGPATTMKIAKASADVSLGTPAELTDFIAECKSKNLIRKAFDFNDVANAHEAAEQLLLESENNGIGVITYFDTIYPERLRNLRTEDDKNTPPVILYYKGNISAVSMPAVAIIGTRNPTKEGMVAGEQMGRLFAEAGFNIVSGLALGCASAGYRGALSAKGVTTAFLAHGLDTVYPPENTELAERIIDNGGILFSEYPIGTHLSKYTLVDRDRLQSGLSQATIVIQTGEHGGTMHAANATLVSNKPLYVIKYKSDYLMYNDKVKGNSLLVSKGAEYLSSDNVSQVIERLSSDIITPTGENVSPNHDGKANQLSLNI